MSEASRPTPQEFEKVLTAASTTQASFDEDRLSFAKRLQRFLHSYPTTVPFVVLVLGLLLGCTVNLLAFRHRQQSVDRPDPGDDHRHSGNRTDARHPDRGHRSFGRRDHGHFVGRHGTAGGRSTVCRFSSHFRSDLSVGLFFGWLNGALVTRMQMPPFIVTLGTLSIIGALNTFYSRSETIGTQDIEEKAPFLQLMGVPFNIGSARIILASFLLIVLAIVFWYVLNRTAYGRHIYATGDDPEAARLAGINTDRILLSVYVLAGLIAAIAGWALIGRIGAISPTAGENGNLDSITAVVIGGTSLFGGRGSIIGTLIGALIVGVFRSAVSLAGLDVLWQEFAIGVLIIVAVALDQWIRRVSK